MSLKAKSSIARRAKSVLKSDAKLPKMPSNFRARTSCMASPAARVLLNVLGDKRSGSELSRASVSCSIETYAFWENIRLLITQTVTQKAEIAWKMSSQPVVSCLNCSFRPLCCVPRIRHPHSPVWSDFQRPAPSAFRLSSRSRAQFRSQHNDGPSFFATTEVVPEPRKGSKTTASADVLARMTFASSFSGFCVG